MHDLRTVGAADTPTQFLATNGERYAYRRLGQGSASPLLCLQHFMGTLDNWDPALIDGLAAHRDVILFDNAGVGRSSGMTPRTVECMAEHAFAFLDGLGVKNCDALGFSLGGMVAQQMALDRPATIRRMILVGTAPRGGEDVMHLEKPSLARYFGNPELKGYDLLAKVFFTASESSQAAAEAFVRRLALRITDREPPSGPEIAEAQMAAFREWDETTDEWWADLKQIGQPVLVVNGVRDEMIPGVNSYWLSESLPNAVLVTYPDAGHGSLFQYHETFTRLALAFLSSDSASAASWGKAPAANDDDFWNPSGSISPGESR
jgi:pimeloyl-ACP methyl ester carboxylesterase